MGSLDAPNDSFSCIQRIRDLYFERGISVASGEFSRLDDTGLSLDALVGRNPDFRVVVRGEFPPFIYGPWADYDGPHSFFENYMPAVASKSFVNYEYIPQVENRIWGLGDL